MKKMVQAVLIYKYAIIYLFMGMVWLLFLDGMFYALVDHQKPTSFHKVKEWIYLIMSFAVLCLFVYLVRRRAERSKETLQTYCQLTNLPNQIFLEERLNHALDPYQEHTPTVAVMLLVLDRFKPINESLGHVIGDQVLMQAAERLLNAHNKQNVYRIGEDEFAIIMDRDIPLQEVAISAQNTIQCFSQSFQVDDMELFLSASIGISVYPTDGVEVKTLLKNAEIAMYRAKEAGSGTYQFYTSEMQREALDILIMEGSLRKALDRNQFRVYFQPQIEVSTGSVLGVEALVRWYHPEWGVIPPNRFIPIAEKTGFIVHIGEWVLREACMQAKAWADQDLPPMKISVNISARQFEQSDIVERVQHTIKESGIHPRWVTLELTESVMMNSSEESNIRLQALKQLGINIALDDFGTGYSSLSYLKKFPIDILKMDKSFVSDITIHEKDAAIATAIITLAHHLDMQVVAEGVETEEQFTRLTQLGSDHVQGYLFSAPQPAELFLQWLQTHYDKTDRKEDPKWLSAN